MNNETVGRQVWFFGFRQTSPRAPVRVSMILNMEKRQSPPVPRKRSHLGWGLFPLALR